MKKLSYVTVALLVIWILSVMFSDGGKQAETFEKSQDMTKQTDGTRKTEPKKTKSYGSSREDKIKNELLYLNDVQEVAWYEVDDNDVYIGFSPVPNDWNLIIRGAALRANKAIDFGVHVWALKGSQRGWRPGKGTYLGEVTARYGRVKD